GLLSHSMALLADGWHMSTHVTAFLITAIAYYFTRRHASNVQFSFGTGKIGVLGGFASAVVLSVVAFLMAGESVRRLFVPMSIHFNEAIGIACIALTVNLVCAFLLKEDHHHSHDHDGHSHRSEEHTSELQSPCNIVCRLLLEKKKETDVGSSDKDMQRSRSPGGRVVPGRDQAAERFPATCIVCGHGCGLRVVRRACTDCQRPR